MNKISVKEIIEFKRRSERSRLTFLNNLEKEKNDAGEDNDGGGDYWISCLSAIKNVFKYNDKNLIQEKIEYLHNKIEEANNKMTKSRWQKNIDILYTFQDFDLQNIRPNEITLLKKSETKSILQIKKIPVEAKPSYLYTFQNNAVEEIGAIWFVAKLGGYNKTELGMFCDIIFRYLNKNYNEKYQINQNQCIAVDVFNGQELSYAKMINDNIPFLLDGTIDEINNIIFH